ncbi:MAG: thioredoxin family protein [Pirellulales bacterium]
MSTLTLIAILQASILAAPAAPTQTYAEAHKVTKETGRPLVVMVGADWCSACQEMKQTVIPELEKEGVFKNVSFAYVNSDQQQKLAGELLEGRSIPQLIMFHKTPEGWKRGRLIGMQPLVAVRTFLRRGIEARAAK